MIPKIIHYCWLSNDPIPESLQNYMKTWKEKLPDYEFVLWNFDRFEKSSSLWVSQAFDNKKYAFAADYIRLFAVYNYGGIYLDMDIEVLKSFDDLLDSDLMIAYENDERTGIEAGCFGAEKGNQIIKDCLDYYCEKSFIKEDGTFDTLPLPKIMIKIVNKYPELNIYDASYFTCKSFETGEIEKKDYSYAVHNFAGSWLTKQEKYFTAVTQKINGKIHIKFVAKIIINVLKLLYLIFNEGLSETKKKVTKKLLRRK